jgi:hypothetical protein
MCCYDSGEAILESREASRWRAERCDDFEGVWDTVGSTSSLLRKMPKPRWLKLAQDVDQDVRSEGRFVLEKWETWGVRERATGLILPGITHHSLRPRRTPLTVIIPAASLGPINHEYK